MERTDIKSILESNIATVTFEKVDGSIRKMRCTLQSDFLPELKGSNNKRSDKVLPVWDLEKNAWRSFRIENVMEVEVEESSDK